jgi:hypothetical protein
MAATLTDPVRAALLAGWTVDDPDGTHATVHCPNGRTVTVPRRSGPKALDAAMDALNRHGLAEALAVVEANRERTTARVVTQVDGERAEREALARRQAQQDAANTAALRRATTGYFVQPDDVPLVEILAPHPAPKVYRVLITPPMAQVMLARNTRNRKPRASDITQYGGAMKGDAWLLTHQPIAFDTNGVLLDGQQRLFAIMESGTAADLFVMCGMPPESFDVVDTGRRRSAADTLYVDGEVDVNRLAAVARMLYVFDADPQGDWRNRVSNHIISATVKANPKLREAVARARPIAKATRGNLTAMSAGVYLLWRAMSPEHPQVLAFLDGVEVGVDGRDRPNDPRLRLRNTTITAVDRKITRDSRRQLALWLKGWRAYALGRKVEFIGWRKDEQMPGVFVVQPDQDGSGPAT